MVMAAVDVRGVTRVTDPQLDVLVLVHSEMKLKEWYMLAMVSTEELMGAAQVELFASRVKSVGHVEHWLMAEPRQVLHVVSHLAQ